MELNEPNMTTNSKQNGKEKDLEKLNEKTDQTNDHKKDVILEPYKNESQIDDIMRLITKDLSEPYSIFTYRYFLNNWPKLCILARKRNSSKYVGVIICKIDEENTDCARGYIAMLAVDSTFRNMGIGTRLVQSAIEVMREYGTYEVTLETEVSNKNSTNLYSRLGFIREKRLFRYYLNGADAFRLKLFFKPKINMTLKNVNKSF